MFHNRPLQSTMFMYSVHPLICIKWYYNHFVAKKGDDDMANTINTMHMCAIHDEKCFFALSLSFTFYLSLFETIEIMQIIILAIYERNLNCT